MPNEDQKPPFAWLPDTSLQEVFEDHWLVHRMVVVLEMGGLAVLHLEGVAAVGRGLLAVTPVPVDPALAFHL